MLEKKKKQDWKKLSSSCIMLFHQSNGIQSASFCTILVSYPNFLPPYHVMVFLTFGIYHLPHPLASPQSLSIQNPALPDVPSTGLKGFVFSCVSSSINCLCVDLYHPVWSCVVIYGHVWSCMVMCGHVWSCMVMYGQVWKCMVIYGQV